MKYHAPSRRLFLRGAGAVLALPLLESLVPRFARAQTGSTGVRPVRYLQVLNAYGSTEKLFFGSRKPTTRVAPNVNTESLEALSGAISPVFGTEFNNYRSRMSLIRGVDTLVRTANHNFCFATCASSYAPGLDGDKYPPVTGQLSVDALIAASSKVYGASVPQSRRLVTLNPLTSDDYTSTRSFSWQPSSTGVQMVKPVKATDAFYDVFSTGFGDGATADPREQALMSAVWEDFKTVRDGPRISFADKQRLDTYMGLIADISKGASTCQEPTLQDETTVNALLDNQFRLIAAAMACDLTRVASIMLGMSAGYGTRHSEHHSLAYDEQNKKASGLQTDFVTLGKQVSRLLAILDSYTEGTGTLLDNSVVYYGMQYGLTTLAGQHNGVDMAVMVAGGGGGTLNQGNYIDLRRELGGPVTADNRRGVPTNNLLVSLMNAIGLDSSDYESAGRVGYGDYPDGWDTSQTAYRPDIESWSSDEGKRRPLPVLYKGPARG